MIIKNILLIALLLTLHACETSSVSTIPQESQTPPPSKKSTSTTHGALQSGASQKATPHLHTPTNTIAHSTLQSGASQKATPHLHTPTKINEKHIQAHWDQHGASSKHSQKCSARNSSYPRSPGAASFRRGGAALRDMALLCLCGVMPRCVLLLVMRGVRDVWWLKTRGVLPLPIPTKNVAYPQSSYPPCWSLSAGQRMVRCQWRYMA